jgi:hypothetical protein
MISRKNLQKFQIPKQFLIALFFVLPIFTFVLGLKINVAKPVITNVCVPHTVHE